MSAETPLTIRRESGWATVNLENCSPSDFLIWVRGVYPGPIDLTEEDVETEKNRSFVYNKVLHFHTKEVPKILAKDQIGLKYRKKESN